MLRLPQSNNEDTKTRRLTTAVQTTKYAKHTKNEQEAVRLGRGPIAQMPASELSE